MMNLFDGGYPMRDDHIDPEDYVMMDYEPELDFDEDEWKRGRCFNCGTWALENPWHEGEYECPVCGDIWSVYESAPQVP